MKCILHKCKVRLNSPYHPPRVALGETISSISRPLFDGFACMRARSIRIANAHRTSPHSCESVQRLFQYIYPVLLEDMYLYRDIHWTDSLHSFTSW